MTASFLQIFSMPIPDEVDQISKSISKARKEIQVKKRGLERFKENLEVLTGSLEVARKELIVHQQRRVEFLANDMISLEDYRKLMDTIEHYEDLSAVYPIDITICQQTILKYTTEIKQLEFDVQIYEKKLQEWGQIRPFPVKA